MVSSPLALRLALLLPPFLALVALGSEASGVAFAGEAGVPEALARLAGGRALLALLPPGRPGSHAPRHLAATLAWSWILGLAFASPLPAAGLAFPFAALVALGFAFLGPAKIVPRHERLLGAPRGAEHALWVAPLVAAAVALRFDHSPLDAAAIAAAVSVGPGATLRSQPRGSFALAGAGLVASWLPLAPAGALVAATCAAWSWIARAERRGLALAAIALGIVAAAGAPFAAGLAAIQFSASTAAPTRTQAFVQTALGAVAGSLLGWRFAVTA